MQENARHTTNTLDIRPEAVSKVWRRRTQPWARHGGRHAQVTRLELVRGVFNSDTGS
jgi:hypothetical protein